MSSGNERYGYQAGSQTEEPYNPSSEYAEVQGNIRNVQSSAADEAEAGVKVRVYALLLIPLILSLLFTPTLSSSNT
jgi:hypothetical protein